MRIKSVSKGRRYSAMPLALVTASAIALSGCAGPIIGALTLAEISTIAGLASTLISGQDLTEHALSLATGEDCRILEAILRENRDFCEEHGSDATANDFEGVVALLEGGGQTATALADAHDLGGLNPMALGFAPIDRSLEFSEFSLEMVEDEANSSRATRLSFGFMSASFGQSWAYELTAKKIHRTAAETPNLRLALADDLVVQTRPAPQPLPARRADGRLIVPD